MWRIEKPPEFTFSMYARDFGVSMSREVPWKQQACAASLHNRSRLSERYADCARVYLLNEGTTQAAGLRSDRCVGRWLPRWVKTKLRGSVKLLDKAILITT